MLQDHVKIPLHEHSNRHLHASETPEKALLHTERFQRLAVPLTFALVSMWLRSAATPGV